MTATPASTTTSSTKSTTTSEFPMTAAALDGQVDVSQALLSWPLAARTTYSRVYRLPDETFLYVFRFGAVVQKGRAGLDPVVVAEISRVTGRKILPETEEVTRVAVDPTRVPAQPRVGWDMVVLQDDSPELCEAVALLLAQSAGLERYERKTIELLDEAIDLARYVEQYGRLPWRVPRMTRRIARITADRLEITRNFFTTDKPESTWEDYRIARLYDALFDNLELERRHRALQDKLEAMEGTVETLVDLWQGRQSHWLEVLVVLLIVGEILLMLWHP